MERRKFIRNTGLGIGSFLLMPSIVNADILGTASQSQIIPLAKLSGQIRHGALILPQVGYKNEMIAFDWLDDITRNVFYENGFKASPDESDLEIVSILLTDPQTGDPESIQVQRSKNEVTILYEDLEWSVKPQEGIQLLVNAEEEGFLKIHFGEIQAGKQLEYEVDGQQECYVHLLKGAVTVQNQELKSEYGLGLTIDKNINFEGQESSQFLILSKI